MPELAEVEYYRKVWDPGLGDAIVRASLDTTRRPLRGISGADVAKALIGSRFLGSEARAKQMLFWF